MWVKNTEKKKRLQKLYFSIYLTTFLIFINQAVIKKLNIAIIGNDMQVVLERVQLWGKRKESLIPNITVIETRDSFYEAFGENKRRTFPFLTKKQTTEVPKFDIVIASSRLVDKDNQLDVFERLGDIPGHHKVITISEMGKAVERLRKKIGSDRVFKSTSSVKEQENPNNHESKLSTSSFNALLSSAVGMIQYEQDRIKDTKDA